MKADVQKIQACLDKLIQKEDCVLSYDLSLADQLPDLMRENFGVHSDAQIAHLPALRQLFELLTRTLPDDWKIRELPRLLVSSGADLSKYSSHRQPAIAGQKAADFEKWSPSTADDNLDAVLALQKDLGMGAWNKTTGRYDARLCSNKDLRNYLRVVTSAPPTWLEHRIGLSFWELKIKWWRLLGKIPVNKRSLSIGPRWVTEIEFFRNVVGFRQHIGLDLFSDNPELVVAGDMHAMPFPAGYFHFIFLKNVCDKSYDIRRLAEELIRVSAEGGLVVIDQVCGRGAASPLSRTDIQKAANLERVFRAKTRIKSLVCQDVDISRVAGGDGSRNNARLAMQIIK